MSEVIGKLSDGYVMSCSRLPVLFGMSPWSSPNYELLKSMSAWDASKAGRDPAEPAPTMTKSKVSDIGVAWE